MSTAVICRTICTCPSRAGLVFRLDRLTLQWTLLTFSPPCVCFYHAINQRHVLETLSLTFADFLRISALVSTK